MKNPSIILLSCLVILNVVACQTPFGKATRAWWESPATQSGLHYATQAATQFAVNAGLAALQQYAGGGKLDYQKIAMQGGISTLYQQASNIRQLQGTAQVLDPVATARLLEQGGTSEEISRKLARQLFENASALILAGADPNQAAEVNAAALDAAAAKVAAAASEK